MTREFEIGARHETADPGDGDNWSLEDKLRVRGDQILESRRAARFTPASMREIEHQIFWTRGLARGNGG